MTEQYIYWRQEELDVLRDNYPVIGIIGCMELMPYRTRRSIKSKVDSMKIKKNFDRSDKSRFFSMIEKSKQGCWNWIGQINKYGYGVFSILALPVSAHRYSYVIHVAEIPGELLVLHKCDNPKCVNPSHLFLGTQKDNMKDMDMKGRRRNQYGKCRSNEALFGPGPAKADE